MPRILLCGPNGAGKSTLGRYLSTLLAYPFFDNEDYYFPKSDPDNPYKIQRDESEAHTLMFADMQNVENTITASVRGNLGEGSPFPLHAYRLHHPPQRRESPSREKTLP